MATTFVDLLQDRACQTPERLAYTFLLDGETTTTHLTYGELDQRALALASRLQTEGLTGQRALLVFAPGLDYITAFLGCLYAGVVAVPVYPPLRKRTLPRLLAILVDADAKLALTTSSMQLTVGRLLHRLSRNRTSDESSLKRLKNLQWLVTDDVLHETEGGWQRPDITDQTLAFLQYTSGSTGTPKGVMVSHGNLLENQRVIQQGFGHTNDTVVVGWLPLYHDMGLIGNVLQPLYVGGQCILMAPNHFLQKPSRWLSAISRFRGTTSGGPNFAYDLCVNRITPEQRDTLDLSCWKVAFNGAEPIRASTLEAFETTFKPSGFRRETFYPCYGLAEATLMVCGGLHSASPVIQTVQKSALEKHDVSVLEGATGQRDTTQLVGCGHSYLDHQLVIVDPRSFSPCSANRIGEIWVTGPSVTQGYWNRPEESDRTFSGTLSTGDGGFLRTGDLGFVHDGDVFITGRLKDLMIIRGRNHYPQDIEFTVSQSHAGLRDGGGAVFSIDEGNEEHVVVVQEIEYRAEINVEEVASVIRSNVAESHDVQVYAIVLIKPGSLLKTSSGKVQRSAIRDQFLTGGLEVVGESLYTVEEGQEGPDPLFNPMEEDLAEMWSDVLECGTVRRDSNFFALGGDSLRGIQVLARVQEMWSVELSLEELFEHPALTQLAQHISARRSRDEISADAHQAIPLKPLPPMGKSPLTFAQQRLWFLAELDPDSPFYNIPIALKFTGDLNVSALEWSLQEIVRRHEVLRARFPTVEGKPVQVIAEQFELLLDVTDLTVFDEAKQALAIQQSAVEEAQKPFDLADGPLVRVKLFRLNTDTHVLFVTMHHIVADGWSMGILVRELGMLYASAVQGQTSPLPDLPIQYADYVQWQRRYLHGAAFGKQLEYWREQLQGAPAILALPTDRQRPAVQSYRGTTHVFVIPSPVVQAIRHLSQQHGVTVFMTLVAVFKVFLMRYTDQADVSIGTPVANRTQIEVEGLIGCFVNTLVLRTNLSGDPLFTEVLVRVRETVLGAQAHQAVPFEQVVEALQPVRELSHSPLFQVMMALQNMPLGDLDLPGLQVSQLHTDNGASQFDLNVAFTEEGDKINAVMEYNTDLFDKQTIEQMAEEFNSLSAALAKNPHAHVSEYPILTEFEQRQVLVEWNETGTDYSLNQTVVEQFEARVVETPHAKAVISTDGALTYAALNTRANQVANYLRRQGVGPEVRVGLCVERSLDMVASLLGILKTGGTYVPIDPAYPQARQEWMMADAQIAVLVTQKTLASQVPYNGVDVLCLDSDWDVIESEPIEQPMIPIVPEQGAYMIYTSGSTGIPKGVVVTHGALSNHMQWYHRALPLTAADRVPQKYSLSFDVGSLEILAPVLAGARLCLMPPAKIFDSQALAHFLLDQKVTVLDVVPSVLRVLLEEPAFLRCRTLRRIVCGGEVLSLELQARVWAVLHPTVELHNLYGPTETTMDATAWACRRGLERSTVPIGRPIGNTQAYVLDRHLMPVPIGVWGELHIGGEGLARGYHQNPELTAARFLPDPFGSTPGRRLYKTGDRVRYLADGNLEYHGRLDDQVKVRGFRIEVGEIEAMIAAHSEVEACAVTAYEEEAFQKKIVAYVEPKMGPPELWPSVGEYPVYDAMMYYAMTHDELRTEAYRKAIEQVVPGKTVVDLGTGADVVLARMCVEAGAKQVYAVEMLEDAYHQARALVEEHNLTDKITLFHGDATHVQLPERVDVCVSELLGHIASSEGVVGILNDARRFLKNDGVMIPYQSVTNIAAVSLPDALAAQPRFSEVTWPYVQRIFSHVGHPFDVRVGIKNFPRTHVLSDVQVFEELVFTGPINPVAETKLTMTMQKSGRIDGMLLWLTFSTINGHVNDILTGRYHQYSWIPVFFPVFYPGLEVQEGDCIQAVGYRLLDDHPLHPNYQLTGRLVRKGKPEFTFAYDSVYQKPHFQETPFYQKLFANKGTDLQAPSKDLREELREHLERHVPDYMIPSAFHLIKEMPLTPNGKVDRQALPVQLAQRPASAVTPVAPATEIEKAIASVWRDTLYVQEVGIHDNFFELGGNSLLLTQVKNALQSLVPREISIIDLFKYPTIHALAEYLMGSENGHVQSQESLEFVQRIDKGTSRMAQQRARRQQHRLHTQEEQTQ